MKKMFLKLRIFGIAAAILLVQPGMYACTDESEDNKQEEQESASAKWEIPDRQPTMTDYWNGVAGFVNFYSVSGDRIHTGSEIVPVNGVWYWFERFYANNPENYPGIEILGLHVSKSYDKGLSWTEPVRIIEPFGDNAWSHYGCDSGAWFDGARWHILFQSVFMEPRDSPWCLSYLVCDGEDATGEWYEPPGVVNPVIHNGDIWNTIAVGDNNITKITGGEKRIFDEGTPKILVEDDGTIYVTFHGASVTKNTIFGYRGIATTEDFITYTKAADDCIFSYLDAESWDIEWNRSGSVGGGAAAYIKDGEYWYTLIESPDLSIGYGGPGQMWPFGLLRSKTLTNTEWEIWSENPPPELTPVVEFAAWNYPSLFEDEGITYLGISQENPNTYRIFRLEWKEGAVPLTAPSPKRRELPPRFEGTPTGTVYEADMNSKEGWNLMHSLAEGEVSVFTVEDGRYTLAMDQISRPLKIDLTKNPVFSVTVDEFDAPKLFVRLQIPGLAARPGYDPGYIGFEPLGFDGVQTFNINEELEWAGYFDSNEAGVKDCVLYVWAYQCEAVISDIRIEYYE